MKSLTNPLGAGRKPMVPEEKKRKLGVSLSHEAVAEGKKLGDGFLSRGIERAILNKPKGYDGNSHRRAPKMEKEHAAKLGLSTVKGSGSGFQGGDIRKRGLTRIECKTTKNKSFSVTREIIDKIERAASADEHPAIIIEFTDGFGRVEKTVAVIPLYALEELLTR